jgi:multidrug efflux pump subunit AcrA (membrane-fusion protein)
MTLTLLYKRLLASFKDFWEQLQPLTIEKILRLTRENIILSLAIFGFFGALVFSTIQGRQSSLPANQITSPPISPFVHNISGTGLVEANTRNINVGSFSAGIVDIVHVKEGDIVKKGTPLFSLDRRTAEADVTIQQKRVNEAEAQFELSKVNLVEAENQLRRARSMKPGIAISNEEMQKRIFSVDKAQLEAILKAQVLEQQKSLLNLAKINLDKLTIKAPSNGLILKVRVKPGEFISEQTSSEHAPILMGNHSPLHLRVQIDENDFWRFKPEAKAIAYLKSNKDIKFSLSLVRVTPYAMPKQHLNGDSSEKVDTRIIEVIYKIDEPNPNVLIGQQLDVFIEAERSI